MNYIKTPELTFSEFNGKWEVRKLGELIKVNMCKRIFSNQTTPIGEIPFYKIGTLGNKPDSYISRELFEEYKNKYNFPRKGEILITCSGTVGKTIVYDGRDSYYQDSNIVWLENNNKIIYNNILRILLSKIDWSKRLNSTTIIRLYNDDIRNLKIEFPVEKEEQQKIGDFFILLDKRIEQQEQKIALLKDYKKAMMQKIFSQKIRFKDENGNDYPDWEEKKLGEMFEIKKGIQISKKDLSLNGQKCILYGELFTRYDEIIENVTSKTNLDILPNSKYHDILMPSSDVTPNGLAKASCLLENDVILGGDINILRYKNENVFPPFFSYQINYFKKKIMDVVSGTTIKHVYSKNIEKLNYKLPLCIDEQEKITSFLLAIENNIKTQKEMVETLKKEKISLLNKMFV